MTCVKCVASGRVSLHPHRCFCLPHRIRVYAGRVLFRYQLYSHSRFVPALPLCCASLLHTASVMGVSLPDRWSSLQWAELSCLILRFRPIFSGLLYILSASVYFLWSFVTDTRKFSNRCVWAVVKHVFCPHNVVGSSLRACLNEEVSLDSVLTNIFLLLQ